VLAAGGMPAGAATSLPALDRMAATWKNLHDYSVTIEGHEVLGDRTSDNEFHYAFRKPHEARLDVITGNKSGSTILWDGGDRVTAYRRRLSFFKMHGSAHAVDLTSLRGNGVLNPDEGDVIACLDAHRDRIAERDGPTVEGEGTDELAFSNANISCPDDPATDKDVTLDVIDVSKRTGLVVMRKRYIGNEVVERWQLKDFKVDSGLTDGDLH